MKRYIRSSNPIKKRSDYVNCSSTNDYTDHYNVKYDNVKFSVYTKYGDDPEKFQCQISELHPYDDASYAWVKKNSPIDAIVYKNGKPYGHIEVRDWDDDAEQEYRGNTTKFISDMVQHLCQELRKFNKDVKPEMVHN